MNKLHIKFFNMDISTSHENNMDGYYLLIIYNASVHKNELIACLIKQHYYRFTYLALIHQLLNPTKKILVEVEAE